MLTTTSKTQDTCYGSIKYEAKLPCSHTGRAWSPWCCPGQWVASSTVLSARLWPPRRPPSRRLCPGTARSPPCGEVWWTWEWRVITHRVDRDNLMCEYPLMADQMPGAGAGCKCPPRVILCALWIVAIVKLSVSADNKMSAGYFKTTGTFMYSVICLAASKKMLSDITRPGGRRVGRAPGLCCNGAGSSSWSCSTHPQLRGGYCMRQPCCTSPPSGHSTSPAAAPRHLNITILRQYTWISPSL